MSGVRGHQDQGVGGLGRARFLRASLTVAAVGFAGFVERLFFV
jgi:hypothetical protein